MCGNGTLDNDVTKGKRGEASGEWNGHKNIMRGRGRTLYSTRLISRDILAAELPHSSAGVNSVAVKAILPPSYKPPKRKENTIKILMVNAVHKIKIHLAQRD